MKQNIDDENGMHTGNRSKRIKLGLWCSTSLSTIFQLYCGSYEVQKGVFNLNTQHTIKTY